jgi:hypothetical protein
MGIRVIVPNNFVDIMQWVCQQGWILWDRVDDVVLWPSLTVTEIVTKQMSDEARLDEYFGGLLRRVGGYPLLSPPCP